MARQGAVRLARREPLTEKIRPAITLRADAAASTTSRLAFVTIAIRPSCRVETTPIATDLRSLERRIFLRAGLDAPNQIDLSWEIGFFAQRFSSRIYLSFLVLSGEFAPQPLYRGHNEVNNAEAIWTKETLAIISSNMTMLVIGILLCGVMTLYFGSSAAELHRRPVPTTGISKQP